MAISSARVGKIYHYGNPGQIGTSGLDDPASWEVFVNPRGDRQGRRDEGHQSHADPGARRRARLLASPAADEEHTDGKVAPRPSPSWKSTRTGRSSSPPASTGRTARYIAPQEVLRSVSARPDCRAAGDAGSGAPPAAWFTTPPHWGVGEQAQRETIQAYYASITFLDANVGRVLDALDRLQLADNTIVVFISDHGYHLGEQGQWMKQTLFERSARAPLIVAGPGVTARGRSSSRVVEFLDLYPTLAALASVTPPAGLQGRSLAPLLKNPDAKWDHPAVTQVRRGPAASSYMGYSVRTEKWRYTEWENGKRGAELYDQREGSGRAPQPGGRS